MLGIASKLPIIGSVDKLLGVLCGGAKGIILCWIVLAVVPVVAVSSGNAELASYISQSQLLTWMQDNNLFLKMFIAGQ